MNNPKVNIYLIRHGRTQFNQQYIVQGWVDSPLTSDAEIKAQELGRNLKNIHFVNAYCSDLGRQQNTAKIILHAKGQDNIIPKKNLGLREACFGSSEGKDIEKALQYLSECMGFSNTEEMMKSTTIKEQIDAISRYFDNAESFNTVSNRMYQALETIVRETLSTGGGNVLVVSSAMSIQCLLSKMVGGHIPNIPNLAVTKIVYENKHFTVEYIGDTKHIA